MSAVGRQIVIPLAKIDEEKRLVVARAVQEIPDRSGEILDYATAVPAFREWSSWFEKATNGLSKGNVRVQHDAKTAAGKVVDLVFNDEDKAIDVVMKIVDDAAWRKVCEGVYTGVSVGGGYGKKWRDEETGKTRYTPIPRELSLVDFPCIPTATIVELHKAGGIVEPLPLHGRPRSFAECLADVPPAPRSFDEVLAKNLGGVAGLAARAVRGLGGAAGARVATGAVRLGTRRLYRKGDRIGAAAMTTTHGPKAIAAGRRFGERAAIPVAAGLAAGGTALAVRRRRRKKDEA